jgi:transposase
MADAACERSVAQRQHLLAAFYRMDSSGRLAATAPQIAESAWESRADRARHGGRGFGQRAGKKGGAHTGPSPVDRAKNGCKRHIIIDADGVPLLVACTPANVRDEVPFLPMLDSMPPVKMPGPGAPRYRPKTVIGDAAYGFQHIIRQVVERRIRPLLAPRATPGHPVTHGSGLGKMRYPVERTISWFANFRRIDKCYERTGAAWQAFNELACCMICFKKLKNISQARLAA